MDIELSSALSIPLGAILAVIVEIAKIQPVPPRLIQAIVLAASLILAIVFRWDRGTFEILVNWIITFSTAISSYELILKQHGQEGAN